MKKILLAFGAFLLAGSSFSQVIFSVEEPANIAGGYEITNPTNWSADMSNPANSVLDTIIMAEDSLACAPLTNDLTGKIALIYRGSCNFSSKALAAQNAGAIAVIIVNNVPGAPAPMGAGADGASVTIPVIMVGQATGALIHAELEAGTTVIGFIGQKNGYYDNDLGMTLASILRADANAYPGQLAQNGTEFSTALGGWIYNYGQQDHNGITLNVTVNNGTEVYNETSTAFNLLHSDSAQILMPDFSLSSYPNGTYTITYTINYGVTDEYPGDNTLSTEFIINDTLFSMSRVDSNHKPVTTTGLMPSPNTGSFSSCLAFQNDNASRIGVAGMYFSGSVNAPDSLDGREVLVQAFKWNDVFTDLNDANFGFTDIVEVTSAIFNFGNDNPGGVAQYQEFPDPFVLEDGQRYLFCVQTFDMNIFFGYDDKSSYNQNIDNDLQPFHPIESNGSYFVSGFTGGAVPALAVRTFDANESGLNENAIETQTYPNPAKDLVTVKVKATGDATLNVTDLSGRVVSTQNVKIVNGQFVANVSEFKSGTYVFNLSYSNGTSSQFKVVVTK